MATAARREKSAAKGSVPDVTALVVSQPDSDSDVRECWALVLVHSYSTYFYGCEAAETDTPGGDGPPGGGKPLVQLERPRRLQSSIELIAAQYPRCGDPDGPKEKVQMTLCSLTGVAKV